MQHAVGEPDEFTPHYSEFPDKVFASAVLAADVIHVHSLAVTVHLICGSVRRLTAAVIRRKRSFYEHSLWFAVLHAIIHIAYFAICATLVLLAVFSKVQNHTDLKPPILWSRRILNSCIYWLTYPV